MKAPARLAATRVQHRLDAHAREGGGAAAKGTRAAAWSSGASAVGAARVAAAMQLAPLARSVAVPLSLGAFEGGREEEEEKRGDGRCARRRASFVLA